jgi:hypothetical protein
MLNIKAPLSTLQIAYIHKKDAQPNNHHDSSDCKRKYKSILEILFFTLILSLIRSQLIHNSPPQEPSSQPTLLSPKMEKTLKKETALEFQQPLKVIIKPLARLTN